MRLLLVRHGSTIYNQNHAFTGQIDAPLSDEGQQQAEAVGRYLAQETIDAIFSSDLQRARDTGLAIAQYHQLPVQENPDLREVSLGTWEGRKYAEVEETDHEVFTWVRSDPANNAPPGGESYEQLPVRAARVLDYCLEQYTDKSVLWATHGGLMGVIVCHALRLDLKYRRCFEHDNTSVTELHFKEALPRIARLNDTAHLRLHKLS